MEKFDEEFIKAGDLITIKSPVGLRGQYQPYVCKSDGGVDISIFSERGESPAIVFYSESIIHSFRISELFRIRGTYDQQTFHCVAWFVQGMEAGTFVVANEQCLSAMKVPIHENVIRVIIEDRDPLDVEYLNLEVLRGRILWRPEFRLLGIEKPDPLSEGGTVLSNFEGLLDSYIKNLEIKDQSLIAEIRSELTVLGKNPLGYLSEVIVAGAGIRAFDRWSMGIHNEDLFTTRVQMIYDSVHWAHQQRGLNEKEVMEDLKNLIS